jgi:hypothetical protein
MGRNIVCGIQWRSAMHFILMDGLANRSCAFGGPLEVRRI